MVGSDQIFELAGELRAWLRSGAKTLDLVDIQVLDCVPDGVLRHGRSRNWQGKADFHSTGPGCGVDDLMGHRRVLAGFVLESFNLFGPVAGVAPFAAA
ncbi:hypothetical protein ABZ904_39320 [Streptomyces sp. NPDC046900]|uniref:hypothetical protein n=1 Tax=Streptomyces sp. NPDC046900 TaxID=3155473 RepID=UPI0033CC0B6D